MKAVDDDDTDPVVLGIRSISDLSVVPCSSSRLGRLGEYDILIDCRADRPPCETDIRDPSKEFPIGKSRNNNNGFSKQQQQQQQQQQEEEEEEVRKARKVTIKNKLIGFGSVLILIIIWVSAGYLIKVVQNDSFDKPFFTIYISQSICSILLLVFKNKLLPSLTEEMGTQVDHQTTPPHTTEPLHMGSAHTVEQPHTTTHTSEHSLCPPQQSRSLSSSSSSSSTTGRLLHKTTTIHYFVLGLLILSFRYLWMISLRSTAVSINTVVYNFYIIIVFVLSIRLLNEKSTAGKILAVGLGFFGVVLISLFNNRQNIHHNNVQTTAAGILFTIASALFYALYTVLYKILVPSHGSTIVQTLRTVGKQALAVVFMGLPLLVFLHVTGMEPFVLPPHDNLVLASLAILCMQSLMYYSMLAVALTYCSPLFVSLATIFVLPLTAIIDYLAYGFVMNVLQLIGTVAILASFVLITWEDLSSDHIYPPPIPYGPNKRTSTTGLSDEEIITSIVRTDSPVLQESIDRRTQKPHPSTSHFSAGAYRIIPGLSYGYVVPPTDK